LNYNLDENGNIDLSWKDIDVLVQRIADNIDFPVKKIIGIARGGLIPAVMLSNKLDIPMVPITWQTRDLEKYHDVESLIHNNEPDILIFDDMVDSGQTYLDLYEICPAAKFGALFNKKEEITLDICGEYMYNVPNWLIFPWEK